MLQMQDMQKVNMKVTNIGPLLSDSMRETLTLSFTTEDIRKALWSIDDNKAPGLDGYNSGIYKAA